MKAAAEVAATTPIPRSRVLFLFTIERKYLRMQARFNWPWTSLQFRKFYENYVKLYSATRLITTCVNHHDRLSFCTKGMTRGANINININDPIKPRPTQRNIFGLECRVKFRPIFAFLSSCCSSPCKSLVRGIRYNGSGEREREQWARPGNERGER